jgi:signal transduction histidine kinase
MNPFRPPVTAIRWGALAVGLVLAGTNLGQLRPQVVVGAAVLFVYAGWRSHRPINLERASSQAATAFEAVLHLLVVAATGYWESPFVLSLLTAVVVVGFARGLVAAVRVAAISTFAVALPYHLTTQASVSAQATITAQWVTVLLLIAVIAGYARRFSVEVAERHSRDLDRLEQLAQANTLLHSLHDVAQALPTSLDLDEACDSVIARVRTFYEVTALALFLVDDTGTSWTVMRQHGTRLAGELDGDALPGAVIDSLSVATRVRRIALTTPGQGMAATSRSGLYAPLRARGEVVGVLAMEHDGVGRFSAREADVLDGFVDGAALAIDNARRFGRLRRVSAAEERSRIAGEFHDRVGQSLACMAFEIDLLVRHRGDDQLRPGLEQLRHDLRAVIGDIRDTLSDLRSDVSEDRGLVETTEAFLERVSQRSGRKAVFHYGRCQRLPLPQERVMWRILYETVNKALRRGDCAVEVWWACDGSVARLEVTTDIDGFDADGDEPSDPTWTAALHRQAADIGAYLEVDDPIEGTSRLRCSLGS